MLDARDMPRAFAFPHSIKVPQYNPLEDTPPLGKSEKHSSLKQLWQNESGSAKIKLTGKSKHVWLWEQRIQRDYKFKEE